MDQTTPKTEAELIEDFIQCKKEAGYQTELEPFYYKGDKYKNKKHKLRKGLRNAEKAKKKVRPLVKNPPIL